MLKHKKDTQYSKEAFFKHSYDLEVFDAEEKLLQEIAKKNNIHIQSALIKQIEKEEYGFVITPNQLIYTDDEIVDNEIDVQQFEKNCLAFINEIENNPIFNIFKDLHWSIIEKRTYYKETVF